MDPRHLEMGVSGARQPGEAPAPLLAVDATRRHRSGRGVFHVDLTVGRGEVVCLLGPNGSGKTTLLRLLATVDPVQRGSIRWFGQDDRRAPGVRRRLGVVLDGAAHFDEMTGYQNAWFFARRFGAGDAQARDRLNRLFSWSELGEAVHRPVKEYSLGMRQRLALVEALAHGPRLLLLDEPTLGLDWAGSVALGALLEGVGGAGASVVLSTNDVHLAERLAHRIVFLDEGRVVRQGTPAELLAEVGGLQQVELEVRAPIPLQPLRAHPGVEAVSASGATVRLLLGAGANPVRVLGALDGHAGLLTGLRVARPHLGDAFLRLVGRPLDEASRGRGERARA
jgi:ABC-2 type transport system ATP-binding protein